jgi:5-(carboxyamino)imidazole ribonucleotide mutase
LDGAKNAGILAAQIIGASHPEVLERIIAYKESLKAKVMAASDSMKNR